jgi:hypothetical protein
MARFTTSGLPVVVFLVVALANGNARGQVLCQNEADDIAALRSFERSVTSYTELHRRLDAGFMAMWLPSDPEANAIASSRLANAIRSERRNAGRGDIFNPEVADFFRVRLSAAHVSSDFVCASDEPYAAEEGSPRCEAPTLPLVNSRLGWGTSIRAPEPLADLLPELPLELEYRLEGRALILVDVSANLVVDIVDEALP